MKKKLNQAFNRVPTLLRYVLIPFLMWGTGLLIVFLIGYLILSVTGVYSSIESALDLNANSPWIKVPLYVSLGGALLCFLVGSLMYFHKYKRTVTKTAFQKAFSEVLEKETKENKA